MERSNALLAEEKIFLSEESLRAEVKSTTSIFAKVAEKVFIDRLRKYNQGGARGTNPLALPK
jgi:hypothetical protein